MQPLIAFLFMCFLVGGTTLGRTALRRPILLLAVSVVFAASYYSLRVIQ
jgi:hypothetical protein